MISVITSPHDALTLAPVWDRIVAEGMGKPDGIGLMSRCDLALAAWQVYSPDSELHIHVLENGNGQDGLLPCYLERQTQGILHWRQLGVITDIYPGRTGILSAGSHSGVQSALLEHALTQSVAWDLFTFTVVAGSASEQALLAVAAERALQINITQEEICPFIEFPDSWEAYLQTKTSKFRYNLRKREAKLGDEGELTLRCIRNRDETSEFLDAMLEIDRHSWKERAGTSMTQRPEQGNFHRQIAPDYADKGLLRCYLLVLNGEPVAYLFGMLDGTTYYNLKSSYREEYKRYSPGVILKAMIMRELVAEGLRLWDFVGTAEPHKLQWSSSTYTLRQYTIFNRTFRGMMLYGRRQAGRVIRRLRGQDD